MCMTATQICDTLYARLRPTQASPVEPIHFTKAVRQLGILGPVGTAPIGDRSRTPFITTPRSPSVSNSPSNLAHQSTPPRVHALLHVHTPWG